MIHEKPLYIKHYSNNITAFSMSRFSNYQRRFRSNQLTNLLRFNIYFKIASLRRIGRSVSKKIKNLSILTAQHQEIFVCI